MTTLEIFMDVLLLYAPQKLGKHFVQQDFKYAAPISTHMQPNLIILDFEVNQLPSGKGKICS